MACVHGLSNGQGIEVYSEPGLGTTFKIYLPRILEAVAASKSWHDVAPAPRGNETVLLVEDEEAVRALSRAALEQVGYTILEAQQGIEALEVAKQYDGPIHLLVSDVVMPAPNGRSRSTGRSGCCARCTRT